MIEEIYSKRYGATINGKHTLRDLGVYPKNDLPIDPPEPKTYYLEIPGADGSLDMTEVLTNSVIFKDRACEWEFTVFGPPKEQEGVYERFLLAVHGRRATVIRDEEPDVYLEGRLKVGALEKGRDRGSFPVSGVLRPYRIDLISASEDWLWDPFSFETGVIRGYKSITIDGETAITIVSSVLGGYPTITTSAAGMTVTHDGTTYNLSKGKNALADIELPRGEEEVELVFDGSGTVSIDYATGRL